MRSMSAIVPLLLAVWLVGCGPRRIEKLPVPQENVIRSYRLMAEGDQLLAEDKDHLALLKYIDASVLNPYHEVIFNKLAITYSRLQQFEQARAAVNRSIGLNLKYAYAYNTLGIVHLATGQTGDAVKAFSRSIELRPESANFYVNLGYAYMQDRKFDRGLESYRKALELDPKVLSHTETIQLTYKSEAATDAERQYQMARLFAALGNKDACLYHLSRALSAGFADGKRIQSEQVFQQLRGDSDFIALLNSFGLNVG